MSSVRMCDRCGAIFSEREEGWQTFTGTTMRRDPESRRMMPESVVLDACPACAVPTETPIPMLSARNGHDDDEPAPTDEP